MLVLRGVVMVCLVMALCVCEPHVVFLFSSGDFGACCGFPFIHGVGNFVPVQCFAMDSLAQALPEPYYSSLGIEGPTGSKGESFEGGNVGVDVPSSHGEFHELVICILLFGRVCPGIMKCSFKFSPEYLIIFVYVVWLGGVCVGY